jgi:hypothetical protein
MKKLASFLILAVFGISVASSQSLIRYNTSLNHEQCDKSVCVVQGPILTGFEVGNVVPEDKDVPSIFDTPARQTFGNQNRSFTPGNSAGSPDQKIIPAHRVVDLSARENFWSYGK